MAMRQPAVAGKFYPRTEKQVREEIDHLYDAYIGKRPSLNSSGPRDIVGLVVPHAGYIYSGPVAAHAYAALAEDGFPETFIVIGPNHSGLGSPVAMTTEDFDTPLGRVRIDQEIVGRMGRLIADDPTAHRYEHSIEVQLPFIQYLREDITFVPIAMAAQDYETAAEVGHEIKKACQGRDVVIVASTDFSHYVPAAVAARQDRAVIDRILALDAEGVYDTVVRKSVSMCGYGPVMAMLLASGGRRAELLKYGNSGDVSPMEDVVGYASIKVSR
ncbi:MAG: MEMO1 family protein [Methanomassiliicoccus sp.]|nr:MEMO1 family protein [Methanomassiliicoccus sp.]